MICNLINYLLLLFIILYKRIAIKDTKNIFLIGLMGLERQQLENISKTLNKDFYDSD